MSSQMPFTWINAERETTILINEVKVRPILYDKNYWRYCDDHQKRLEWKAVTQAVFAEFWEAFSEQEKSDRVAIVRKRWSYLKGAFKKEVKRQNAYAQDCSKRRRPYLYYENLLFLKSENVTTINPDNNAEVEPGDDDAAKFDMFLMCELDDMRFHYSPVGSNFEPDMKSSTDDGETSELDGILAKIDPDIEIKSVSSGENDH